MAIHIKPSHEGLLHKDLGVKSGKKIPAGKLEKAEHSNNPAVKKRAVFAENAKHWNHGGKKNYDRSGHNPGNPGFPSSDQAGKSPLPQEATVASEQNRETVAHQSGAGSHVGHAAHHVVHGSRAAHTFGGTQKCGVLRLSGKPGAHQIGCKR